MHEQERVSWPGIAEQEVGLRAVGTWAASVAQQEIANDTDPNSEQVQVQARRRSDKISVPDLERRMRLAEDLADRLLVV